MVYEWFDDDCDLFTNDYAFDEDDIFMDDEELMYFRVIDWE